LDYGCRLLEMTSDAMLKKLKSLLTEATARSEEQISYIKELESDLSRARQCNCHLRKQSLVDFVSRNIRVRLRLVRKRSTLLVSSIKSAFGKIKDFRSKV
jgi:hypothetical protein